MVTKFLDHSCNYDGEGNLRSGDFFFPPPKKKKKKIRLTAGYGEGNENGKEAIRLD